MLNRKLKNIVGFIFALCLCFALTAPAWAIDKVSVSTRDVQSFSVSEIQTSFSNSQILEDNIFEFVGNEIKKTVINQSIATLAENQPPVAELQVVVLNPESMINGNFTTDTQLAWLWSYNGNNFTYDPDGDGIADMKIGGISSSDIIGTVGEIGFVTQFQQAGQYVLTFQVQDTNGAWSNIAQYSFTIESVDGNTRPVCRIGYSADKVYVGNPLVISWANSYDADPDDSIAEIGGMIIKDGVTKALKDYVVLLESDYCAVSFDEPGQYEIWVSVADTHNAWSDWVVLTITVESAELQGVEIYGVYEPTSVGAWWVNNIKAKSIDIEGSWEAAEYLAEQCGSHQFPSFFPAKIVASSDFKVSGQLFDENGNPLVNSPVRIKMSLTYGRGIYKTVYTNSNGEFSYNPGSKQFWLDSGYYTNADEINYLSVGDRDTDYIRYSKEYGTHYLCRTSVTVEAAGAVYSEDVTCLVGYRKQPAIGNIYYTDAGWVKR